MRRRSARLRRRGRRAAGSARPAPPPAAAPPASVRSRTGSVRQAEGGSARTATFGLAARARPQAVIDRGDEERDGGTRQSGAAHQRRRIGSARHRQHGAPVWGARANPGSEEVVALGRAEGTVQAAHAAQRARLCSRVDSPASRSRRPAGTCATVRPGLRRPARGRAERVVRGAESASRPALARAGIVRSRPSGTARPLAGAVALQVALAEPVGRAPAPGVAGMRLDELGAGSFAA